MPERFNLNPDDKKQVLDLIEKAVELVTDVNLDLSHAHTALLTIQTKQQELEKMKAKGEYGEVDLKRVKLDLNLANSNLDDSFRSLLEKRKLLCAFKGEFERLSNLSGKDTYIALVSSQIDVIDEIIQN
jgi:hypothetical protein